MATSYRKQSPLEPRDILVFDKVPAPPPRKYNVQKVPESRAPTALYETTQLVEAINQLGKYGKFEPGKLDVGDSFTLSPRHAWIEDRGFIDAFNAVIFAPDMPTIQFIDSVGPHDDARKVDIWLRNLTPGRSYIAQVRVLAGEGGEFHVRTGEGVWGEMEDAPLVYMTVYSGGKGDVLVEWFLECQGCPNSGAFRRSGQLALQAKSYFDECLLAPDTSTLVGCVFGFVDFPAGEQPAADYTPPFTTGECVGMDISCPQ